MLFRPNSSAFTNPMTTTGDIIYSSDNAGTASRLAKGSDGQALVLASGIPSWGTPTPGFNYIAKSSAYNPAVINDWIYCTGASFTITLPDATAAGNAGKMIAIQHAGSSLVQVYQLNCQSGQTIGGVASGSYSLYTNSELLILASNGTTDWQIVSHKTDMPWQSGGTIASSITGSTSNPSFGTLSQDYYKWMRHGSRMLFYFCIQQTAAGSGAGSGTYLVPIPSNASIDTNVVTANTTVNLVQTAAAAKSILPASGWGLNSGNTCLCAPVAGAWDSSHIRIAGMLPATGGTGDWGSGFLASNLTTLTMAIWVEIPILGWQP